MKKRIVKIISATAVFAMLVSTLSGCSFGEMTSDEYSGEYISAVANTVDDDLYFWKETVNKVDIKTYQTCNVYAEIDKEYQPIRGTNGQYANHIIDISETSNNKEVLKIVVGNSKSSSKGKNKDMLFTTTLDENSSQLKKSIKEMSPHDYFNSTDFQEKYSPKSRLAELSRLTIDDMDFEVKGCGITKKGNTTLATFGVKEAYLTKYKEEFGKDSLFSNSVRVSVEIAYEKISSLIVYGKETLGGGLSVETESYKFEIVYFGPIATVPSYDATETDKTGGKVPVWTNVAV